MSSTTTVPPAPESKVPLNQKIIIGFGEAVLATAVLATGFFMNAYFLEVACLEPDDVAFIQVVQGIFDLLNDPIIGTLSDHTKTRLGRRRPWMLLGTCLLPISFFLNFSPSLFENPKVKAFYYFMTYCGISVGMTCINISVASLVPEMTEDYDERSTISSFRLAVGNLVAFGALMAMSSVVNKYDKLNKLKLGYQLGGLTVAIIMASSGLICFLFIREKSSATKRKKGNQTVVEELSDESTTTPNNDKDDNNNNDLNAITLEIDEPDNPRAQRTSSSIESVKLIEEVRLVLKNKAFLWLLCIWLCGPTAFAMLQSALLLYCKYIMNDSTLLQPMIALTQGMAMLSLPLWVWIMQSKGKRTAYQIGAGCLASCMIALNFTSSIESGFFFAGGIGFCLISVYLVPYRYVTRRPPSTPRPQRSPSTSPLTQHTAQHAP